MGDVITRRLIEETEVLAGWRGDEKARAVRWRDIDNFFAEGGQKLAQSKEFFQAASEQGVFDDAIGEAVVSSPPNQQTQQALDNLAQSLQNTADNLQVDYQAAINAKDAAEAAAIVSTNKAGEASTSAGAAASSQSDAAQSANSASTFAGNSATSANQADTSAGDAETARSESVAARSGAENAAAAAATHETVTAQIKTQIQLEQGFFDGEFLEGSDHWYRGDTPQVDASASPNLDTTSANIQILPVIGEGNVLQTQFGYLIFAERGYRPVTVNQTYQVTIRFRLTKDPTGSANPCKIRFGFMHYDESGAHLGYTSQNTTGFSVSESTNIADGWVDFTKQIRPAQARLFYPGSHYARLTIVADHDNSGVALADLPIMQFASVQIEDLDGQNGLIASTSQIAIAQAQSDGRMSSLFGVRVIAGSAVGEFEIVALSDPDNGDGSQIRAKADTILFEGSVFARHMTIDELLAITQNGALTVNGKTDPLNLSQDGAYFGRNGNQGFGFGVSRTRPSGEIEYITCDENNGLVIGNAQYKIKGGLFSLITRTSSGTQSVPSNTQLVNLTIIGGGHGGEGLEVNSSGPNQQSYTVNPGQNGGTTNVKLYDGSTFTGTQWNSAGATDQHDTRIGQSSSLGSGQRGSGGNGHAASLVFIEEREGADEDYVAEGLGGEAGNTLSITNIDVSSLSNPNFVVTIGIGGAPGNSSGTGNGSKSGTSGKDGVVLIEHSSSSDRDAQVISKTPSSVGTFSVTASTARNFPDFGAGYWEICTTDNSDLDLLAVQVASSSARDLLFNNQSAASFFSEQTPYIRNPQSSRTVRYKFYPTG